MQRMIKVIEAKWKDRLLEIDDTENSVAGRLISLEWKLNDDIYKGGTPKILAAVKPLYEDDLSTSEHDEDGNVYIQFNPYKIKFRPINEDGSYVK